jgi:hypothetical protein
MTVTLTSPATIFQLADAAGALTRAHWAVAKAMWKGGTTYAFHADADLIALAGLYPLELDAGPVTELWFCPLAGAGAHVGGITRLARLTLAQSPYPAIYTICRSEEGKRFARVLGFKPAGSSDLGEIWSYGGRPDRRSSQEAIAGPGRYSGRQPAAIASGDGAGAGEP